MDEVAQVPAEAPAPAPKPMIRHSRKRRKAPASTAAQPDGLASHDAPRTDEERPDKLLKDGHADAAVASRSAGASAAAAASSTTYDVFDEFSFDPSRVEAPATRPRTSPFALLFADVGQVDEGDNDPDDSKEEGTDEQSLCRTPRTYLIHSPAYAQLLDRQSVHCRRMHYFTSLLRSLQVGCWRGLTILPPRRASMLEMEQFHSRSYLDAIRVLASKFERHATGEVELMRPLSDAEKEAQQLYGLIDDCPPFPELFDLVQFTIGGSLRAVDCLVAAHAARPLAPVTACHWGGGRHHGESECAKGFCYCNDAVCACLQLLSSPAYPRVLYLDIDVHHGDGVEQAFVGSSSVLTCSFHHHAPGFFPGTGAIDAQGKGDAKHNLLNLPLHEGIDDATFCLLFDGVMSLLLPSFRPSVVVMCCGVDGLASDRMSPFNLTTRAYARIVQLLKKRLGHYAAAAPEVDTANASSTSAQTSAAASHNSSATPISLTSDDSQSANVQLVEPIAPSPQPDAAAVAGNGSVSPLPSSTSAAAASDSAPPPSGSNSPASWPSSPIPLLLLGGGGYCPTDTARAFVHMTASACGQSLPASLPDSDPFYPHYLPNLSMHSLTKPVAMRPNANDRTHLRRLLVHVRDNCRKRDQPLASIDEQASSL